MSVETTAALAQARTELRLMTEDRDSLKHELRDVDLSRREEKSRNIRTDEALSPVLAARDTVRRARDAHRDAMAALVEAAKTPKRFFRRGVNFVAVEAARTGLNKREKALTAAEVALIDEVIKLEFSRNPRAVLNEWLHRLPR